MIKDYDYSSLGMTIGLFPYRLSFTSSKTQEIQRHLYMLIWSLTEMIKENELSQL